MDNRAASNAGMLAFVIVVIIGVAMSAVLMPTVLNSTNSSALGLTGGAATFVNLIPTMFILLLVVVGIVAVLMAVFR